MWLQVWHTLCLFLVEHWLRLNRGSTAVTFCPLPLSPKVAVYLFEEEMKEAGYLLEKSLDENEAFPLEKYSD